MPPIEAIGNQKSPWGQIRLPYKSKNEEMAEFEIVHSLSNLGALHSVLYYILPLEIYYVAP